MILASLDVKDPQSPLVERVAPYFSFTEEFYQFRIFLAGLLHKGVTILERLIILVGNARFITVDLRRGSLHVLGSG
jgi:hypothetical protein